MKGIKILLFAFIIGFIGLVNVEAETCSYNYDGATLNITVDDSGLDFSFSGMTVQYKRMTEINGKISLTDSTAENLTILSRNNFINSDGEVDCGRVANIMIDANTTNNSVVEIYYIGQNTSCNISKKVLNANSGNYLHSTSGGPLPDCASFALNSSNANDGGSTSEGTEASNNSSGEHSSSGTDDWNLDSFCSGPIEGTFTTIGWVFFFAKILIPLTLIIFASIDLGKAVVSSKDDAISKAVKTLVVRVIAGIIIFFIPTILDFVVGLIGGSDIYNQSSGTFSRCTHCMLEPTDDSCRGLIE